MEQAKWKIAPPEELKEPEQSIQANVEDDEESADSEYWNYLSPEMLAEDGIKKIGFLKLPEVLTLIPVSKTTWWDGIKAGRFPKGYKLSENTTGWDVVEIRALISKIKCEQTP